MATDIYRNLVRPKQRKAEQWSIRQAAAVRSARISGTWRKMSQEQRRKFLEFILKSELPINGTNGQCELVGVDVCEAMRDDWTGPCVLTRQTHGYECGHCGSLLAIHSHGYIVARGSGRKRI